MMNGTWPGPGALATSATIDNAIVMRINKKRTGGRDRGDQGNVRWDKRGMRNRLPVTMITESALMMRSRELRKAPPSGFRSEGEIGTIAWEIDREVQIARRRRVSEAMGRQA